jgi:hypothetical protein
MTGQHIGDDIAREEEVAPPPDPADPAAVAGQCPVLALGARDGIYHYLSPRGEYRALPFRDHKKLGVVSLFDGDTDWLWKRFPRYSKDSDEAIGWHEDGAATWLMRRCAEAGFFNPDRDIRGVGAWRIDPASDFAAAGPLILHCGDGVRVGRAAGKRAWQRPGLKIDDIIYPAGEAMPRPADTPAPATIARELRDHIASWSWRNEELSPLIAIGWIAQAMIVGATDWLAHILLTGDKGCGKTEYVALVKALLGRALIDFSSPSEPAVRQSLRHGAHPVAVDEIENKRDNTKILEVIDLVMLASSANQAPKGRGSRDGTAVRYPIRACFLLQAILHPPLSPAAASRIFILELERAAADLEAKRALKERLRYFAEHATSLRARMVEGFERFTGNLDMLQRELVDKGYSSRQADQYGTLLAAARTLLYDEPITVHVARHLVDLLPAPIKADEESEDDDHVRMLNHLMTSTVDRHYEAASGIIGREPTTIGELLQSCRNGRSASAQSALRRSGIAVKRLEKDGPLYAIVANQHRGLDAIFAGTIWADGVWQQSLRRVPLHLCPDKTVKFAGRKSRGTWLPLDAIVAAEEEDDDA